MLFAGTLWWCSVMQGLVMRFNGTMWWCNLMEKLGHVAQSHSLMVQFVGTIRPV